VAWAYGFALVGVMSGMGMSLLISALSISPPVRAPTGLIETSEQFRVIQSVSGRPPAHRPLPSRLHSRIVAWRAPHSWNALSDAWLIRRLRLPCLTGVAQASRSGSIGFVLPR
jgi:hypothetical protein